MTPAGMARLRLDEGCVLSAYPDPGSPLGRKLEELGIALEHYASFSDWRTLSGDPWTIGYGNTGQDVRPGVVWTQAQADAMFNARVQANERRLLADLPWMKQLDGVRFDCFSNIAYNVGVYGLEHWPNTLRLAQDGKYTACADALRNEGKWNRDVGARSERIADAMESGRWA